eukprot:11351519-Heterocapsa_arctica.AAC.1
MRRQTKALTAFSDSASLDSLHHDPADPRNHKEAPNHSDCRCPPHGRDRERGRDGREEREGGKEGEPTARDK